MIEKSILGEKKEFADVEELKQYVKSNLDTIIDFKKGNIQFSRDKNQAVKFRPINTSAKLQVAEKDIAVDDRYYYIAVNTTNILDSHDDLHVNGIWGKTIQDQQGKNYLVADHDLSIGSTIVKKEHIEMFVATTSFESLGYAYKGDTQVLVYKFLKEAVIHDKAKDWLESGDEIQASVRMQYVTVEFAMQSNDPEDEIFNKRYIEYLGKIANRAEFAQIPYFFIVKEAKNIRESSLVLFGSNPVTGNIIAPTTESSNEFKSENIEPSNDIQKSINKSNYYHLIHNKI